MRSGRSRAPWAPDRVHKVKSYSMWRRRHGTADQKVERWKVTALFKYEQSSGDVLSVRIHCFGGPADGRVLHMSEARMLNLFIEMKK